MHPHLRLAASLILTAGLVSACGGGGSSGAAAPAPVDPVDPPVVEPTTTSTDLMGEPSDCTAASDNCIITTRTGETVTEVRRIETAMNRKTVTVTVNGTMRTVTVTSTASGTGAPSGPLSVEMLTCTGGENCMRTSLREVEYKTDGTVNTDITRHYVNGRVMRKVSGTGDAAVTTTIAYSSSNGGRTETTVKAGGRLVETFSTFAGTDATSTMFISTDGNTVTMPDPNDATMRIETTSAGGRVTMVRTGMPADGDTGFAAMAEIRITRNLPTPANGRGLVAETYTQGAEGANDERPAAVLVSRTYIRTVDADGRETRRKRCGCRAAAMQRNRRMS